MITLISTILGFITGFIPEFIKLWKAREDRKHELAIMDRQMEMQKLGHTQRLEEIQINADVKQEELALEASRIQPTGVHWVDAILALVSGLVRPVVTYSYFTLYGMVKYAKWKIAVMLEGMNKWTALNGIWTDSDDALFGTIMGFWFGQRSAKWWYEKTSPKVSGKIVPSL